MKLTRFDGGISRQLQPMYIGESEAVQLVNVDTDKGSLTPVKREGADEVGDSYYFKGAFIDAGTAQVEFDSKLFYVKNGELRQFDGSSDTPAGLPNPTTTVTLQERKGPTPVISVKAATTPQAKSYEGPFDTPTNYVLVKTFKAEEVFSKPLLADVDNSATSSKLVSASAIRQTQRTVELSTDSKRTVTFGPLGLDLSDEYAALFRLVNGKFWWVGSSIIAGNVETDYLSDTLSDEQATATFTLDSLDFCELEGTYAYVVTWYDSTSGTESGPSPLSAEIDCTDSDRLLLNIPQPPSGYPIDTVRLYRVGGDVTVFTKVADIPLGTLTYLDTNKDEDIARNSTLETEIFDLAPANMTSLTESAGMLFGSLGTDVRFTPVNKPAAWPEEYALKFKSEVLAVQSCPMGVLVFLANELHLIAGTSPTALQRVLLSADQGLASATSVASLNGTTLWASKFGICTSSGQDATLISKAKLGKIDLSSAISSTIFDRAYYLLLPAGKVLVLDFSGQAKFKEFQTFEDAEYLIAVGTDIFVGRGTVVNKLFSSTEAASLLYVSPELVEGSQLQEKLYKRVRLFHFGDIILKVLIDRQEVAAKSFTGEGSKEVLIPASSARGYRIQFEVSGTGEVLEIEYEVESANL